MLSNAFPFKPSIGISLTNGGNWRVRKRIAQGATTKRVPDNAARSNLHITLDTRETTQLVFDRNYLFMYDFVDERKMH